MIKVHLDEEQRAFEWRLDRREARQALLMRVVQVVWWGIFAAAIVAAMHFIHQVR